MKNKQDKLSKSLIAAYHRFPDVLQLFVLDCAMKLRSPGLLDPVTQVGKFNNLNRNIPRVLKSPAFLVPRLSPPISLKQEVQKQAKVHY